MANTTGKKFAGRQKGTPNKKNQEIIDFARELGVDPGKYLVLKLKGDRRDLGYEDLVEKEKRDYEERVENEKEVAKAFKKTYIAPLPPKEYTEEERNRKNLLSIEERDTAAEALMPYFYGKRKPIDSDGNDKGDPLSDLINELRGE